MVAEVKEHPYWTALKWWVQKYPQSQLRLKFQDGIPAHVLAPTEDGLGIRSVRMEDIIKQMNRK
jgi:hypothetical protein